MKHRSSSPGQPECPRCPRYKILKAICRPQACLFRQMDGIPTATQTNPEEGSLVFLTPPETRFPASPAM